jgi:hypothetical protein
MAKAAATAPNNNGESRDVIIGVRDVRQRALPDRGLAILLPANTISVGLPYSRDSKGRGSRHEFYDRFPHPSLARYNSRVVPPRGSYQSLHLVAGKTLLERLAHRPSAPRWENPPAPESPAHGGRAIAGPAPSASGGRRIAGSRDCAGAPSCDRRSKYRSAPGRRSRSTRWASAGHPPSPAQRI